MTAIQGLTIVCGLATRKGPRTTEILLGKRRPTVKLPDLWELPGGKVEDGEDPRAALVREWREELGVTATVIGPLAINGFYWDRRFAIRLYACDVRAHATTARPRRATLGRSALCTGSPPVRPRLLQLLPNDRRLHRNEGR